MKKWIRARISELKSWSATRIVVEMLGWAGTFLILYSYYLLSEGELAGRSWEYQTMNLTAAIMVGINVMYHRAWPPLALQVIWGLISIKTLWGLIPIKNLIKVFLS